MNILWLKTELLHPVDKGGKIRTYHMLKELKQHHHVTYLTLDDGTAAPDARELAQEYCHELITIPQRASEKFSARFYAELVRNLVSPLPYFIKKYESAAMRAAIERQLTNGQTDVLVCDFLNPSINLPAQINCATLLFQHNVEAQIWQRHYEVQTHPAKRAYLKSQWKKTLDYERAACRRFDYIAAVSEADAEMMRSAYGATAVSAVPTGVDIHYFQPSGQIETEPYSLVFTGSMDWLPNEDAIRYFSTEILPLIQQQIPRVKLTVVGRKPSENLLELSRRNPAIIVTGRVNDVRPYIERAAAYVVPLRIGGGTRLKVYEALALEKPVISTRLGAEGLPVRDEVELLLADTPADFAKAVVRVLTDESSARALGAQGAAAVRARFGWEHAAAQFASLCAEVRRQARNVNSTANLLRPGAYAAESTGADCAPRWRQCEE